MIGELICAVLGVINNFSHEAGCMTSPKRAAFYILREKLRATLLMGIRQVKGRFK